MSFVIYKNMAENGCSLEDCYTNLFALTDLTGIKWCKLSHKSGTLFIDPLDDPVLVSFSKCIQADVLCVWRRQPCSPSSARPVEQMGGAKELWTFWYGDEPATLQAIKSDNNFVIDDGSWENGLSYECRTLLFKALHNLIERCLVSQNYVRIGKWFVQPYREQQGHNSRSGHLSMSFLFFLHGESTVCASIDVRQHPPLHCLKPAHLTAASQLPAGRAQVLLAPCGLAGYLTGRAYSDVDPKTHKLLEDWRRFFCVPTMGETGVEDGNSHLPLFVEVIVAGVRLRYPASYVLLTGEVDADLVKAHGILYVNSTPGNSGNGTDSDASVSKSANALANMSPSKPQIEPKLDCGLVNSKVACRIIEKMWQDGTVNSGIFSPGNRHAMMETENREDGAVPAVVTSWEFGEPMQKNMCVCQKNKSLKARTSAAQSSKSNVVTQSSGGISKHIGDRQDKSSRHMQRSFAPYHRRTSSARDSTQPSTTSGIDFPLLRSVKTTLAHSSASTQPHSCTIVADSPHSAAPSPLTATQTQQPPVNPAADPTMPTLSPHPPPKQNLGESRDGQETFGPASKPLVTDVGDGGGGGGTVGLPAGLRNMPLSIGMVVKTERPFGDNIVSTVFGDQADQRHLKSRLNLEPRKPMLRPMFEGDDDEELVTTSLYEYNLDAVLDPLSSTRRHRPSTVDFSPPYSVSPPPPSNLVTSASRQPASDPYQFSDDVEQSDAGSKYKMREMRRGDEGFLKPSSFTPSRSDDPTRDSDASCNGVGDLIDMSPSPVAKIAPSTTLMRENDLIPNIMDLENLFDTDEEVDADSPQGTMQSSDDLRPISQSGLLNTILQGPSARDLSRMFPTPPSPPTPQCSIASPMMQMGETILPVDTLIPHDTRLHLHHHHYHHPVVSSVCTTTDQPSPIAAVVLALRKECPFVHKLPSLCQFPSSKMYESVELPSSKLPLLSVAERRYQRGSGLAALTSRIEILGSSIVPCHFTTDPAGVQTASSSRAFRVTESSVSIDASPAMHVGGPRSVTQQRTPISYEIMSPASSSGASSFYAGRTIGSVDAQCQSVVGAAAPEASSLFATLALSDSPLGIFRDENFDSCTICVCNMNIDGADVGTLLPARRSNTGQDDQFRCTCAFSAIINRRRAQRSGLFYEDEIDITGLRHTAYDHRKPPLGSLGDSRNSNGMLQTGVAQADLLPEGALHLLREQLSSLYPSCAVTFTCWKPKYSAASLPDPITLEMHDGREACVAALEYGRQAAIMDSSSGQSKVDEQGPFLHPWPFLQNGAKIITNSTDVVQLLKSLQPLLQDAIQKKRSTRLWESVYTISGPLTWKDFHLMAGRGSEETSEPKPVPSLLVGFEQEWMTVSPNSVRHWETLLLEPYAQTHDMLYVVVAPENDYLISQASTFFQQLSVTYEQCRLGYHRPISDKLRDGIMRVGRTNAQKVADEPLDDWFQDIGNSTVAARLRLYAQVCRKLLAPFLTLCLNERKKALEETCSRLNYQPYNRQPQQSSENSVSDNFLSMPNGNVSSETTPPFDSIERAQNEASSDQSISQNSIGKEATAAEGDHSENSASGDTGTNTDNVFVVIYLVDAFLYGQQSSMADADDSNASRLAMIGLLQCYTSVLKVIPEHLHSCIQLQIVPMQAIIDSAPSVARSQLLKNLSFSVYANCRQSLSRTATISRSLTGFGPTAGAQKVLQSTGVGNDMAMYSTPPFILAPPRETVGVSLLDPVDRSNVLLCAYCLSADQRWLLASCTDSLGEQVETTCINIEVPMRSRRRAFSVRRTALLKLWDFLLGIMGQTTTPWRVVIGRFGRLGHGELKGWSAILSRRSLRACNDRLRSACKMCHLLGDNAVPCVISACVVSTELHPSIHIMLDSVKAEDNQRSRKPLSTPSDASCTHILVFPTSATAQANLPNAQEPHIEQDFTDDLIKLDEGDNLDEDMDLMHDLFGSAPYKLSGSPTHHDDPDRHAFSGVNGNGRDPNTNELMDVETEELSNHSLLQQPLAVGFYVSTAPTGPLPTWFWSTCPQRENHCPVCFQAALHIHCPFSQQKEELMHNSIHSGTRNHPLDSNLTCDVLRYVLETYNSLSWLTINPSTGDRRSCLPAHVSVLMQLYHGYDTFV